MVLSRHASASSAGSQMNANGPGVNPGPARGVSVIPTAELFALPLLFGLDARLVQVHMVVDPADPARRDEVVLVV